MQNRPETPLAAAYQSFSRVASAISISVALIVLAGWRFDITLLKTVVPAGVPMSANSGLAFVLCGVALWFLSPGRPGIGRRAGQACAALALAIGLATLSEYVFALDLGIDRIAIGRVFPAPTVDPGRMPLWASVNFALIGLALLLLDSVLRRGVRPAQFLVLPCWLIAFFCGKPGRRVA